MNDTILKRYNGINQKSPQQIEKDKDWRKSKHARAIAIAKIYGVVICEYCGTPAWGNDLGILDGHHIDHDRSNNTEQNCYICHRICHSTIEDKRIKVKQLGFEGEQVNG